MSRMARGAAALGLVLATALVGVAAPASASPGAPTRLVSLSGVVADQSAEAAAGTVGYSVTNQKCYSTIVAFTAKTYETGLSGVQQFRQKAVLQQKTATGWAWRAAKTVTSAKFANTGATVTYTVYWSGIHPSGGSWREVWQGFYLNGTAQVITRTPKVYITCP